MANDSLLQYIKAAQAQGFTQDSIRDVLIKNGWQIGDIDLAFDTIAGVVNTPVVSRQTDQATVMHTKAKPEYNSPYSIGLAAVVCVGLFILSNKFIVDMISGNRNINEVLILDALIILPSLLIAILLHTVFSKGQKQFLILSKPYFIASGYLLVRLLWDTSRYVLNANVTYGIYIVLALIILVLTAIIIFVRNYISQ